ncbi:MAG: biotin--[acetyl-CoA-carboxylase] ligase [Acidimicrobiales bacterium]
MWCIDWDIRRFAEIDSTNTWLLGRARAGAPEGLVAVADHQSAGRGRLGRVWEAPPAANLLVSVLLRPKGLPPERRHLVVACVALAARQACLGLAGVEVDLKWPNDLLVGGAKLAGILAESDGDAVVVGMGLNVGWAPPGACSLAALSENPDSGSPVSGSPVSGSPVSPSTVLDAVLEGLATRYESGDWDAVAADYRRACVTVGTEVRVELADETFTGTAADINDDGHLLVDTAACIRTVTVGDVVHLR